MTPAPIRTLCPARVLCPTSIKRLTRTLPPPPFPSLQRTVSRKNLGATDQEVALTESAVLMSLEQVERDNETIYCETVPATVQPVSPFVLAKRKSDHLPKRCKSVHASV